jgi:hypothetical protein
VRDAKKRLCRVDSPVEDVDLVAETVQALENRIELSIIEWLALHRRGS